MSMRNIEEIAWDLCELYYKTKPPIDENGNVIYYMAGSLATLPFICADSMQEIMIDNGKIIGMDSIYDFLLKQKIVFLNLEDKLMTLIMFMFLVNQVNHLFIIYMILYLILIKSPQKENPFYI